MEKHIKMTEWTEWRGVEVRQGKEGWMEGIPTALAVWGQLGESRTPCSGEQKLPHCPTFFSSYKIYAVRWQVVFYTYHYIFLFIINEWFFNLVSTLNDPLIFLNAIIRLKPISCWYFSPVRTLRQSNWIWSSCVSLCDWMCDPTNVWVAVHQQMELQGCRTLQGWSDQLPLFGLTDCSDPLPFICKSSRGEPRTLSTRCFVRVPTAILMNMFAH